MASGWRPLSRTAVILALLGSAVAADGGGPTGQTTPTATSGNKPLAPKGPIDSKVPKKVHDIIVRQFEVADEKVRYDSHFVKDFKADDLHLIELVMAYERAFDIEIPDEDAATFARVGDVVEYLRRRKALK